MKDSHILLSPDLIKQKILSLELIVFDFDGVFTDNSVVTSQNGKESVKCSRADGYGLKRLSDVGIKSMVISSEKNEVVKMRCKKLGIECHQGFEEKLSHLRSIIHKKKVTMDEVAYVGNDINDLECLDACAFPIVVNDAHPEVREKAVYMTKLIGGMGAVREICDLIYHVRK